MITMNFPTKERRQHIFKLATPIILGMLSINILDLVDTAMIGQLGNKALAATGFASFLFWVCFSAMTGIASGIQTMTSRRLGESKLKVCGLPLNAGLLLVTILAVPISLIMGLLAPFIFGLFSTDPEVVKLSVSYFQWRALGILAIGYTISFRGFWNGIKQPNTYTAILVGTHFLNIFFNWVLIFGHLGAPALGVSGAAIGSSLSLYIGCLAYFIMTYLKQSNMGVLTVRPDASVYKGLIKVGWPASLDQVLFSLSFLTLFWIIGQLGTEAAAIAHVVVMCVLILYLPGAGFGMASLSLVSEALGQGNPTKAAQWAWDTIKVGIPFIFGIGLILFCFPNLILDFFIHHPPTMEKAIFPLRLDLITLWGCCIGIIFTESLIGAGATRSVLVTKGLMRWFVLVPGTYIIGVYLGYGINGIWIFWVFENIIETLLFMGIWQRKKWSSIKV